MNRVGVTSDRFVAVAPDYAVAGLEPVPLPCVRVKPALPGQIAYARDRARHNDLLIITSPRVVSLLWPSGGLSDAELAVVGPSTARSVERAGGRPVVVGDAGLARLVDLIAGRIDGRSVMIAHGAGSDPVAMSRLRRIAPQLEEHPVYTTVPVAPGPDQVDAVAFASPSAVEGWAQSRGFDDLIVAAIGSTTAAAVAHHGDVHVMATRPSHAALARAIASFMEVNT